MYTYIKDLYTYIRKHHVSQRSAFIKYEKTVLMSNLVSNYEIQKLSTNIILIRYYYK